MKNITNVLIIAALFLLSVGCGNNENKNTDNQDSVVVKASLSEFGLDSAFITRYDTVKIGNVGDIISSFSSPVEMAALIEDMNVPFSKKYLLSTDGYENYDTNFKKALALGIYSADLGYLNVYNRTGEVIQYLVVIRILADGLRIGQFFDFQSLKKLAVNNDNLDSLLILSVQSYHKMDEYLRNNNRANLSALMVTGVWLEGLYLLTQVYEENPNDDLMERIGEQKTILDKLLAVLVKFRDEDNFLNLIGQLKQLRDAYDPVRIEIINGEDEHIETEDGALTIQGTRSVIHVTPEQIDNIVKVTVKVRDKIAKTIEKQ